jgi:hypothetical protein
MFNRKRIAAFVVLLIICVITPVIAILQGKNSQVEEDEMTVLTLWQVDSFEGGRGSRAQYLQNKANNCFKDKNSYVIVTSLSEDAVRENLQNGNIPDMISYGAGFYGLESYINAANYLYKSWCRGGYCLITIDGDFSDVTAQNTIINCGKDNFADIAALLSGLDGAATEKPTAAYLALINGKYKYLLGTQRDIYRFKTRSVEIKIKPITIYNDLYQNISILAKDSKRSKLCDTFINYLVTNCGDLDKIGMFCDGQIIYSDAIKVMEGVTFDYKLNGVVGEDYIKELNEAVKNKNANLIKNLLK